MQNPSNDSTFAAACTAEFLKTIIVFTPDIVTVYGEEPTRELLRVLCEEVLPATEGFPDHLRNLILKVVLETLRKKVPQLPPLSLCSIAFTHAFPRDRIKSKQARKYVRMIKAICESRGLELKEFHSTFIRVYNELRELEKRLQNPTAIKTAPAGRPAGIIPAPLHSLPRDTALCYANRDLLNEEDRKTQKFIETWFVGEFNYFSTFSTIVSSVVFHLTDGTPLEPISEELREQARADKKFWNRLRKVKVACGEPDAPKCMQSFSEVFNKMWFTDNENEAGFYRRVIDEWEPYPDKS